MEAGLLSLIASSSLVIGGLVGAKVRLRNGALGAVMAIGAGTLVGAVSFELTLPAFLAPRGVVLAIGLAAGALVYSLRRSGISCSATHRRESWRSSRRSLRDPCSRCLRQP